MWKRSSQRWRIGDRGRPALLDLRVAIVLVPFVLSACSDGSLSTSASGKQGPVSSVSAVSSDSAVQIPAAEYAAAIRALLEGGDSTLALTRAEQAELDELYRAAEYSALWLDRFGRLDGSAREALALINGAAEEGLDPLDYDQPRLERLAAVLESESQRSARHAASFDVGLSRGILRYLRHLHMGRVDPRKSGFRLRVPADRHDFAALVRAAVTGRRMTAAAADLRPPLAQYRLLRAQLARYRALAADATLESIPGFFTALKPGGWSSELGSLHRQLVAFGDLAADAPRPPDWALYEGVLVEGVKRFQVRHGLDPDGVVGKRTLAAMRVPVAWRVRQIELALERLRWLPHLGDSRLIVVNIPMFRLWAWDSILPNGVPSFGMGVIVGRALSTQTPVFDEEMREVIFRPYWNVPRSILRNEILPKIERDPDYLRSQNMEIVRGQGDNATPIAPTVETIRKLRTGLLRVRQRPGPKNALGLIKFVFPNEEDVYMHATPFPELFARDRRDFSHGCVRVEDPVRLAEWVLKDQGEWNRERILAAMADSKSLHVKLMRPIRVILFYTTAAVMPEEGTIWFAEDIYHHDARLNRALATSRTAR